MKRELIKDLFSKIDEFDGKDVVVGGWVRTIRDSKAFGFIELNDGSSFKCLQVVLEREAVENYDDIVKQNVGCSLVVEG